MSLIEFPDVPEAAGVPSVLRNVNASAVAAVAALVPLGVGGTVLAGYLSFAASQWGVYDVTGENKILAPDSFVEFEFSNSVNLPTFPMEPNSFQNYNKVQTPFATTLTMAVDSGQSARSQFTVLLDSLLLSTTLCNIVTPEKVLPNVTLAAYRYRKSARNGVSLLIFETQWSEIRVSAASAGSNTSNPYSAATTSTGQVQASDATTSQVSSVESASDGSSRLVA